MANIKEFSISGVVSFDWISGMNGEDAAMLGRLVLSPSTGVDITYGKQPTFQRNEHGGETAMYEVWISGHEALRYPTLGHLAYLVQSNGILHEAKARDIEDGDGTFEPLEPTRLPEAGGKALVERLLDDVEVELTGHERDYQERMAVVQEARRLVGV